MLPSAGQAVDLREEDKRPTHYLERQPPLFSPPPAIARPIVRGSFPRMWSPLRLPPLPACAPTQTTWLAQTRSSKR